MINLYTLSLSQLEALSEEAEDYLFDNNIKLVSHSYHNIINLAIHNGFVVNQKMIENY